MDLLPSTSRSSPSLQKQVDLDHVSKREPTDFDLDCHISDNKSCLSHVKVEKLKLSVHQQTSLFTQRTRLCVPVADVHSVLSPTRLLSRHPSNKLNLQLQDVRLSSRELLEKTVRSLVDFILRVPGFEENNRYPVLLRPLYRKLRMKRTNEVMDNGFLYALIIHGLLSEIFNRAKEEDDLADVFADWMVFLPNVDSIIKPDNVAMQPSSEARLVLKLRGIPRIRSSRRYPEITKLLDQIINLRWGDQDEGEGPSNAEDKMSAKEFAKRFLGERRDLMDEPDVIRMLSRICRIEEDVNLPVVRHHLGEAFDLIKSCASDAIPDIEDGLRTVARTICTETAPKCPTCPLKPICNAYKKQVAETAFYRLFRRYPQFLHYTLARECDKGRECPLCSLDPAVKAGAIGKRVRSVENYPRKGLRRRRHVAVCMVEESEKQEIFLLNGENVVDDLGNVEKGLKLLRMDLNDTESPSSTIALSSLQTEIGKILNLPESAQFPLERWTATDYVTTDPNYAIGNFFYKATIWNDKCNTDLGIWQAVSDLKPFQFSARDWNDVQNFLYSRQLVAGGDRVEPLVSVKAKDISDTVRLQVLFEALSKRFGTTKIADIV